VSEIQWAFGLFDAQTLHGMGINHRRFQIAVPQQILNGANIIVRLQQVGCKAVPECMRRCLLGDLRLIHCLFYRFLQVRFMSE